MFPVIQVGPLTIQTPGLILIIFFWFGLELSERIASKREFPVDKLNAVVLISLFAGLLGSRISYALNHYTAFKDDFSSLYSLNPGLLDPFGGLVTGLLAGIIYGRKKNMSAWETMDVLTPLLAVLMIGVNIVNLASGNAYGTNTNLPWGINFLGASRHPSQVYAIIASSITLTLLWKDFLKVGSPGYIFLKFAMITSAWLIFLEGFRGDFQPLVIGIRVSQIIALIVFLVSALLFEKVTADAQINTEGNEVENGQDNN